MSEHDDVPPEIGAKFLSFLREVNGEYEVADMAGLVRFVAEYGGKYPSFATVLEINEAAVVEHFKRTGEVPPGVKVIKKRTREGTNVTEVEVHLPPKFSDA